MVDQERLEGGIHSHWWVPLDLRATVPPALLVSAPAVAAASSSASELKLSDAKLWYSPILDCFRRSAPVVVRGGWLADEMGLGRAANCARLRRCDGLSP
jgi:hypothetical protein